MPERGWPFVYVDASSGASGDMFLGALLDLGYPLARLRSRLAALGMAGIRLRRTTTTRAGLGAVRAEVHTAEHQPRRGLKAIRALLRGADLPGPVRRRALAAFERIVEVEAALHRMKPEQVHLHEVGALDALADVVGTIAALHDLGVHEIVSSPVNLGSGTARSEHGTLPVPAPATVALLRGVPVYSRGQGEKTTPTGAALLAVLADGFGDLPAMRVEAVGTGAGARDDAEGPNVLRLLAGRREDRASAGGQLVEIRSQIDDADPRLFGHLMERLLEAGARDVCLVPAQMKKGRPGTLVVVLADSGSTHRLGRVLLDETPTLGYRFHAVERLERRRRLVSVPTRYGPILVKVTEDAAGAPVATPEYEDCRRAARRADVPLREVIDAARYAWSTPRQVRRRPTAGRGRIPRRRP